MLNIAIESAIEAGKFLKQSLGKIKNIERKSGEERNLVTNIDKQAEKMIVQKIQQHFPLHNILAEEGATGNKNSDVCWIIDPLDGTTNFTHGFPIFCVSIGVEKNGELICGVVYDPNRDELFVAEKNTRATLNGKKISVSTTDKLISSLLVTGFPYNITENPMNCVQHFQHFLYEAQAVRRLGSAALDLCYVACGRFDGFWEVALNPWDMAAGVLLIKEAGGSISDFYGKQHNIFQKEILASNGLIHQEMLKVINKAIQTH
ncbi:MAG: inositol monophosphatase [Ignavibacteria bacterium]|nr:inositol monophosphatase [Ignavibacteria bacterium]